MDLASASELADWLRANQDKRNTPDYQTVLRGFQEARLAELRASAPAAPTAQPESGFIPALKAGATELGGSLSALAGKIGLKDEAKAQEEYEAAQKRAKEIFKPTEEGWMQAPVTKFTELLGGSLPYMAAPLAAGVAAGALPLTGLAATAAGLGAAGLTSAGQFTATNLARQMEEGKKLSETDLGAAALAAIPQAALDTLSMRMIPGIGKMFGDAGVKITAETAKDIAEQGLKKTLTDYTLKTGKTAGIEGLTESAQQVFERLQAGLSITDEKARQEYFDNFIGGAVLGGTLSVPGRYVERGREQREARGLLAQQEADQRAAEKQAEEAKKQDPAYLMQVSQEYAALEAQKKALQGQIIRGTKEQPLDEAAKQANRAISEQLAELAPDLRAKAVEFNKLSKQFAELRKTPRPEDEATELAAQREVPQEAQTQPYFQAPQGTLPGMEATPPAEAPEPTPPAADYTSQIRNLKQYLEDLQTQAQNTTNLDAKLQLHANYQQAAQALEQAKALAKEEGQTTTVDSLRKKMAVAEEQGDLEVQASLAQKLKALGITDLGAQPELDLGKPQALGKLQVPTDLADYEAGQKQLAESKAAQEAQQKQQQALARTAYEQTQQTAGMYADVAAAAQRRAADRAAAEAEAKAEAERTKREEELVGKLVEATGAVQPQPVPQARIAMPSGEARPDTYDKATELRGRLAFAQQTRNKTLEAALQQQLKKVGAEPEETPGSALEAGATAQAAGVEGALTPEAIEQNRLSRLAQRQLMTYDQLTAHINQAREREQTPVDENVKAQYKYRAEQLKQAAIGFAIQEINGRREQYGLPVLEHKEAMRATAGLARPLNELIARGAQMFEEPVVVKGQQRGTQVVEGAQELARPPAGQRTFSEAGFSTAADTLREQFRQMVETISGKPTALPPPGKKPGPVRRVIPEQRELFLTPPPAEEKVSLAPDALLDRGVAKAASPDDAKLLQQMQDVYTQLKPEQQSVVREQAQRASEGKPLDAVYEMRGLQQMLQREAATAAGQTTFLKPITLVTAQQKIARLTQQAANLDTEVQAKLKDLLSAGVTRGIPELEYQTKTAEAKAFAAKVAAGKKTDIERAEAAFSRAREQGRDVISSATQLRAEQTKARADAAAKVAELEDKKRAVEKEWDDVVRDQFSWLQTRYDFLREELAAGRAPKTNRAELAALEKLLPAAADRVVKVSKTLDKVTKQIDAAKAAQQTVLAQQKEDVVSTALLKEGEKAQTRIEAAQKKLSDARAAEKEAERVHKAAIAEVPKKPSPVEQIEALPVKNVTRVFRDTSAPEVQAQATKKRSAIAREEGTYAILEEQLKAAEGDAKGVLQTRLKESEARLQKLHNELYDVYNNAPLKRVEGKTSEAALSAERLEKARHDVHDAELAAFNAAHDTARLSLPPRKVGPLVSERGVVKQEGERVVKAEPVTPIEDIAKTRARLGEIAQQLEYIKANKAASKEGRAKQAQARAALTAEKTNLTQKLKPLLQQQTEVKKEEALVQKELKGARKASKEAIGRVKLEATDAQLFEDLAQASKTKEQSLLFERAENAFDAMSAPEQAFVRKQANAIVGRRLEDYKADRLAEVVNTAERRMEREGDENVLPARGVETETPDLSADQIKALEDNDVAQALALLSTDKSADRVHRAVAQRLAQLLDNTKVEIRDTLTDEEGNPVLGQALASGKAIRFSRAGGLTQEVLLHEGTHAAAERVLEAPESSLTSAQLAAKRELQALHAAIKRDPSITSADAKGSLSEFVAEVMSNRKLQEQLSKKPWRLSDAMRAIKSVILRLLGVNNVQSMLGAAMASVDTIFTPTSVQTYKAQGVRTQYSQKDIAALHDGSNSMRQFAENFPQYIKQKDRTPADVDRIGGEYIADMYWNTKDYVAPAEADRLDYKSDTIMSDGKVFDPDNPLHLVEATPATFVALKAQKDESLRKQEARAITRSREKDITDLLESVFDVDLDTGRPTGYASYTLPEQALVAKAATKYSVQSTPEGRLKLVTIESNNRHPVAVVSKEAVDAVIEELRAGKNLKVAFLDGMQRIADENAKRNKSKNGWQKFEQSDDEAAAIALNAGAAGTSWCTGGSVSTARTQLKDGDFYIYYNNGKPEVAVRMQGTDKIAEIRGNTPKQWLTPEQQEIAEAFLRGKRFKGADRFIEETERKAQIGRLLKGEAKRGDSFVFALALNKDQSELIDYKLDGVFRFDTMDGYASSMRPEPSKKVIEKLYPIAMSAIIEDMKHGYIPFNLTFEEDNTAKFDFAGHTLDNVQPSELVHVLNITTPYTSRFAKKDTALKPMVFSNLKTVSSIHLVGATPIEFPKLLHAHRIVTISDHNYQITLSDKAVVDELTPGPTDAAIRVKGGRYVNVHPVATFGGKFKTLKATVDAPYVTVTPYEKYWDSDPETSKAPKVEVNAPNKIADAPPVETATPAEEDRLLFARARKFTPETEVIGRVSKEAIATPKSFIERVKPNLIGLGFRTQFVDKLAPIEQVARGMADAVKASQMMYYLRMYDQRMNFTSQAVGMGAPQLVEKKRKDGQAEWVLEATKGANIKDIVKILSAKDVQKAVGGVDEANDAFTMYLAAKRADRVGLNALNFSGNITQADLDAVVDTVENNPVLKKAFGEARDLYNQYNRDLMNFAVQTGAINKSLAKTLLASDDYIPYYRVREGNAELIIGNETPIRIGNLKDSPHLQELVGGTEKIMNFLDSSVQNTSMLLDMSLRNIAIKNSMYELHELGLVTTPKQASKGGAPKEAVTFKKDGVEYYVLPKEDKLKEVGIPADLLVKGLAGIPTMFPAFMRVAGMPSRFLRRAVVASPVYMARQLFRDSLSAYMMSGSDATPVLGALKQIGKESVLERRGVTGGQVFTGMPEDMSRLLREMQEGRPGWSKALSKLEAMSMEADAATRKAQYESYIKQGLSEMEATLMSLESMNFSKRGLSPSVHMATTLVPFMNAQIQSLDVMYKAFAGKMPFNDRLALRERMITTGLALAAMSLAYAGAMQDDETYKNATPDQKYGNWFVKVPGVEQSVRVPIPFELGYIFKALPEALYNTIATKHGGEEAAEAFKGIVRQLIPGGTSYGLPQAIKPLIEVGLGKSFYTGRDIESAREQAEMPGTRYRDNTSEAAKLVGQATNISPIKIEALVNGYTGSMGLALLQSLNVMLPQTGPDKAAKRLSDMPVVGTLFQPADASGIIDATYKALQEATQVRASYKSLIEKGEYGKAQALIQGKLDELSLNAIAGKFKQQMGELTKAERAIKGSSASEEEKRKSLDAIRQIKIQIASSVRAVVDRTKSPEVPA